MNTSQESFVASIYVKGLWGYRDLKITLSDDINILVGRNASGKTSIINLVQYLLTLDIKSLLEISFEEAVITLREIESAEEHELRALIDKEKVTITLDRERLEIPLPSALRDPSTSLFVSEYSTKDLDFLFRRRHFTQQGANLREKLNSMVPAVWLPVNRGVSLKGETYDTGSEKKRVVTTVEERLEVLLNELKSYRLALDAKLATNYKEFEKRVLELILYNKDYDNLTSVQVEPTSSLGEKEQLRTAFQEAGLMDKAMQRRIEEHFEAQAEALNRIQHETLDKKTKLTIPHFNDIFIVPLIRRTKEMIKLASGVDIEKQHIFLKLRDYTNLVGDFLSDKSVMVGDDGFLNITFKNPKARTLTHRNLSSGEKQIIILLTQALVYEGRPVVYVADEPELSLHVSWQEKLLGALRSLNPKMQLILATHSPDIVGDREVIDLESLSG